LKPGHDGSCLNISISNNNSFICTTGTDGFAKIYELKLK